jgi:rubrerythrin
MTKTSGRKVRCMTCGENYNAGKADRFCPYCLGTKPRPTKPEGKKSGRKQ